MLVIGLTAALMPFNSYAQCPTSPPPAPPCPNANQKTIYSNVNSTSGYDWMEAMGVYSSGEQMTIRPAAFSTSTNLFVSDYLFRSDGGRLAQLSPIFPAAGSNPSYTYGLGNRWNFLGDDLQSPLSHSSSGTFRRVSGFHNFDNKISTVFGSYTDNIYATTLVVDPVLYWQSTNGTNKPGPNGSRLRFIYKDSPIYPYGSETELATLSDNGNFGINSTSPLSKLEVVGGGLYVAAGTPSISVPSGSIYANGGILIGPEYFISTVTSSNVFLATYTGTTAGIGIAAPTGYLHVFSAASNNLDEFKITNSVTQSTRTDGFSVKLVSTTAKIINYENADIEFHTNSTLRFSLKNNGNIEPVGMGSLNIGNNSSSSFGQCYATSWNSISDKRLKNNIKSITYGLNEILSLNPVTYFYNVGNTSDRRRIGFIAQEVKLVLPEAVADYESDSTYLSITYSDIVPVLVKGIQEQQNFINNQQKQISELQNNLDEIRRQLAGIIDNKKLINHESEFGHL